MFELVSGMILYSSPLAVTAPLVMAWYKYAFAPPAFRILAYHLSFVALTSALSAILWLMDENNLPLLHIYTIIEFAFIVFYFSRLFGGRISKTVWAGVAVFSVFAVIHATFRQGWNLFNTLPRSMESLVVIILCITCYVRMLSEPKSENLARDPVFWLNTGWIYYFSGALFLFTMSNYILPLHHTLNIWVWTLHALFSDMLYLFIFIGLWQIRRT